MDLLFSNDYLQVLSNKNKGDEEYYFTKQSDKVVILPYCKYKGEWCVLTLMEPILLWGRRKEITAITGSIEKGEDPDKTAIRELEEEMGIITEWGDHWTFVGEFYPQKSTVDCRYMYLVDISSAEIGEKPTDGSYFEKVAKTVLSELNIEGISQDLALCFLIEKLKNKLGITDHVG